MFFLKTWIRILLLSKFVNVSCCLSTVEIPVLQPEALVGLGNTPTMSVRKDLRP